MKGLGEELAGDGQLLLTPGYAAEIDSRLGEGGGVAESVPDLRLCSYQPSVCTLRMGGSALTVGHL